MSELFTGAIHSKFLLPLTKERRRSARQAFSPPRSLINTAALARCATTLRSWELFQQFARRLGRVITRLAVLWLMMVCFAADIVQAQTQWAGEEYAKLAYKFCKICECTEWPKDILPRDQSHFVIGILGANPFTANSIEWLKSQTVKGHKVEVQECGTAEQAAKCHALFISSSEKDRLTQILDRLKTTSVLTVGESESFLQLGGIVYFPWHKGVVVGEFGRAVKKDTLENRFIVSRDAARLAKLGLRAELAPYLK